MGFVLFQNQQSSIDHRAVVSCSIASYLHSDGRLSCGALYILSPRSLRYYNEWILCEDIKNPNT